MVFRKKVYENIDEIIDFITNENDESDDQMGLGDSDSELESDWEYKAQPEVTFLDDNVAQNLENAPKGNDTVVSSDDIEQNNAFPASKQDEIESSFAESSSDSSEEDVPLCSVKHF